jgi:hypothetical protein
VAIILQSRTRENAVPQKPLALQAINGPAVIETIGLSLEEAEQIAELIRDLRERVHQKQAAVETVEAPAAPAGFRAALRNAFGGT